MFARRLWALAALGLALAAVAAAIAVAVLHFPDGLSVLVLAILAIAAAWYAIRRRGLSRDVGVAVAALLFAGAVVLVIVEGYPVANVLLLAAVLASLAAARRAFEADVHWPDAVSPEHPVLFYNPKSGGGKAERFRLAEEARRRGIEPVELRRGDDLEQLVREAVSRGADAIAMAGGDGSQAVVAKVAAELGLPYACIPAGTRNHFALDLGVDRDDVVGALDAFTNGEERVVDLAEVNGQVFVNNVSLGLYAEAVQHEGYREAKMQTLLDSVPDSVGPNAKPPELAWEGPTGRAAGVAILVSNNCYRLGRLLGSGTRPSLDRGELGVAVLGPIRDGGKVDLSMQQWSERKFEVDSSRPVPAGVDGEAMVLDPPLRFRIRPGALRVRLAPNHPGASPSALQPESPWTTPLALARLAFGPAAVTRSQ